MSCLNDYGAVAIGISLFKTFTDPCLDPFQIAYRENKFDEDAVSLGLFRVL